MDRVSVFIPIVLNSYVGGLGDFIPVSITLYMLSFACFCRSLDTSYW